MRVVYPARPLPHRGTDGVLQRPRSRGDGDDLRPQQTHAVDVQRLALRVLLAHENDAFHPHEGRRRRRGHAVLSSAGFRNQPRLPHAPGQQRLPQYVVDLVRTRMVEVLALQIDFCAAQFARHPFREVETAGPARIIVEQGGQLPLERFVPLAALIRLLQFDDRVHQRLRDVLAPVDAETAFRVRHFPHSSFRHCVFAVFR